MRGLSARKRKFRAQSGDSVNAKFNSKNYCNYNKDILNYFVSYAEP